MTATLNALKGLDKKISNGHILYTRRCKPSTLCKKLKITQNIRFRKEKTTASLILQINLQTYQVTIDKYLENTSLEELSDILPETTPRYIILDYYDDKIKTLYAIFYLPVNTSINNRMVYASSCTRLFNSAGLTKIYQLEDSQDLKDFIKNL